jgi:signal transduction histidine kinase
MRVDRMRAQEIWIGWTRLLAAAFTVVLAVLARGEDGISYGRAWLVTGIFVAGALILAALARRAWSIRGFQILGIAALTFDTAILYVFVFSHALTTGTASTRLVVLAVAEAAVRYGIVGGVGMTLVNIPLLVLAEVQRANATDATPFQARNVALAVGVQLLIGLVVGGLVHQLRHETRRAEARAREAEELRDAIGRHADQLEVVNRCARALASSLELSEAFRAFVRELKTALSFDRIALIGVEGNQATVIAEAGVAADPTAVSWSRPLEQTGLAAIFREGRTLVRGDLAEEPRYPEEEELVEVGMRARVLTPLTVAGRPLGALSLSRAEPASFSREDVELLTLLGRQLATAVENTRAFEAERAAAEELRRLSALRADFVSLVSHELRGPMASVVGCAATLRQRWRSLTPEQRESFLALIEEETSRLAGLVGDVLDTSRVEAGTFTYSFADVDLEGMVNEVAALVDMGQDEVVVRAEVAGPLPAVRGDRERLRQLLVNLVTNAVKYTVSGDEVEVRAEARNGLVDVSVTDHGPGISHEDQRLIFEKFGRAPTAGGSKPGAGLGLFIARSIAEAHGGSLRVESAEGRGARFTVRLPVSG